MWKLKTIEAENLCAFRSLSYMLRQGVTTLIFGDNRDNESQQSNGAGKSALLECIAVGITGSPLRKIRSEEIINDAAEECRIALRFINDSAAEELLVNRRIPRKGASSVSCTLYRGGKQVVTDEAVQPSVDAYTGIFLTNWVSHATSCSTISSFPNTGMRISSRHRTRRRKRSSTAFPTVSWWMKPSPKWRKTSCRSLKRNGRWNWNWPGWTGVSGCYRSRYARRRKPEPSGGVPVWNVSWDWKRP